MATIVVLVAISLAGGISIKGAIQRPGEMLSNAHSLSSPQWPVTGLNSLSRTGGTFARVGQNSKAFTTGLSANWRLTCPIFHQYPFQPDAILQRTLDCLPTADVVIVDDSMPGDTPNDGSTITPGVTLGYAAFRERVNSLVTGYDCRTEADVRVCVSPRSHLHWP